MHSYQSTPSPRKKANGKAHDHHGKASPSLSSRIVECWMRQNHDEYQQALIKAKELQLQILEEDTIHRNILKVYERKKKQINELDTQLTKLKNESVEKKRYLQDFYQFLDTKLKTGPMPATIFSTLDSMERNLQNKFDTEKQKLQQGITQLRIMTTALSQELRTLETKKNALREEYAIMKQEREAKRSEEQKRRRAQKERRIQAKEQFEFLQVKRDELKSEKQKLQNQQKILKKLLNIEELHKKYWMQIESAIKRQFTTKVKDNHYKQSIGMEYKLKLPELQQHLAMRKYECEALEENLEERKTKLQEARQTMNLSIEKYSHLEGEMMSMNNRRSSA